MYDQSYWTGMTAQCLQARHDHRLMFDEVTGIANGQCSFSYICSECDPPTRQLGYSLLPGLPQRDPDFFSYEH